MQHSKQSLDSFAGRFMQADQLSSTSMLAEQLPGAQLLTPRNKSASFSLPFHGVKTWRVHINYKHGKGICGKILEEM